MNIIADEPFMIDQEYEHIKTIKDIIKAQGVNVCRNKFDQDYINYCLKEFDYGFIILGNRSITGSSHSRRGFKYFLKGFVLFRYNRRLSLVNGKILCGHDGYRGIGRILLECVYEFILERKIENWSIYSLPENELIEYYKSAGFVESDTIYKNGKKKVIRMVRNFTYNEKQNVDCLTDNCNINEESEIEG